MSRKTWTLTDVDADIYVEQISSWAPIRSAARPAATRVTKRTLRGGLRDGVDVVEVDNGRFRFVVIPTRGMGIWRASCGDVQLGWKSPAKGPVHPAFVPLWEASGLGWLKRLRRTAGPLRPGEQRRRRTSRPTARSAIRCTARSPTRPPTKSK